MNNIEELIQQLCPEGVEYVKLGEVVKIMRGRRLTKNQLSYDEKYPVYHGGLEPLGYYGQSNRNANTVMVINVGASAGTVGYSFVDFWSSDGCFCIGHSVLLKSRYAYYALICHENILRSKVRVAGIPTLDATAVDSIKIPLPPLPIQQEIVAILDKFTHLQAELQAELQARRAQYEYYREQLLMVNDKSLMINGVKAEWKTLGEIGEFIRGNGLQKKDFAETGVGCIHYGQIYTYYGTCADKTKSFVSPEFAKKLRKAQKGNLVIATTSENVEDVCKAVAWLGDEEIAISGDAYIYKHNQNPMYIAYYFKTPMFFEHKKKYVTGTKVTRVSGNDMAKFKIPIPSLAEQNRIVAILDKFDKLVNDISEGLPAEIVARRKQYEYYRGKLLTFKGYE